NAQIAASEFPEGRIRIVDSGNLSSGTGLLLLKAVKYRAEGDDLETIAKKVEKHIPLVRTQFAINTLSYLHKGGRCSGTSRIIGTLLKIKPIIRVIDGAMAVTKKPRGKYQKALDTLLEYLRNDAGNIDLDNIMITHCQAYEDCEYLKMEVAKIEKAENIIGTKASAVISTHCGPRTIGILYLLKK
ncbi:MAG: DegV family protein, partial [Bacilli bacterium]|nr:DegV family protein [Bacilli bacterium]